MRDCVMTIVMETNDVVVINWEASKHRSRNETRLKM
jgi:hypothetical protein